MKSSSLKYLPFAFVFSATMGCVTNPISSTLDSSDSSTGPVLIEQGTPTPQPSIVVDSELISTEPTSEGSDPAGSVVENLDTANETANESLVGKEKSLVLILGPGALRVYSHIGFLTSVWKSKIPIKKVVGIELSSLVSGIYSFKGKAFDVEWQMRKLKEDDLLEKGLFRGWKEKSSSDLGDILKEYFLDQTLGTRALDWQCGKDVLNILPILGREEVLWRDSIQDCISRSPLFENMGSPQSEGDLDISTANLKINALVKSLGQSESVSLAYVDILSASPPDSKDWERDLALQKLIERKVQYYIKVQVTQDPRDFSQRREMIHEGGISGDQFVKKVKEDFNL